MPWAAAALEVEPYVFAAQTSGDLDFATGIACVQITGVNCPVAASTEDGDDSGWGLGAALRMKGPWWLDLRWTEQDTDFHFLDDQGRVIAGRRIPFDVSRFEAGVLYRFSEHRWSPFATAFGGVVQFDADVSTSRAARIDFDRGTLGVGAGVLADLGDHFGLRLEIRGSVTSLPDEFDGDLEQLEGSAGVRFRL